MAWPNDIRERAIALYVEHGAARAATELGVPANTVRSWASRAGAASQCNEKRAAAAEAHKLEWAARRGEMIHEMGAVAQLALDKTVASIHADRSQDAKAFVTTMAILIDKAQLLAGEATTRSEFVGRSEVDEALADLTERMRATREPADA